MTPLLSIIVSVPKTLWFNLRYLPLAQAVRLPVWVHWRTNVNRCYGGNFE